MAVDLVVAISALEHYQYCPRQCALIHVDGVWDDNAHTVRGERGHRRADTFAAKLERGAHVVRALPLWSEGLGLTGRADAVEFHPDGRVVPVEYKMGGRHGDAAEVQLGAEALCLEEMLGMSVRSGAIWFAGPRRRVAVDIGAGLRDRVFEAVAAVRSMLASGTLPGAVNDARCHECQLLGHCLPGVVTRPDRVADHVRELLACGS